MKTDYCSYPPNLAADFEIIEQRDAERSVFIVGSAALGRYLRWRVTANAHLASIGLRYSWPRGCWLSRANSRMG